MLGEGSEDDISFWFFPLVGFMPCGFGNAIAIVTAIAAAIAFEENEFQGVSHFVIVG